MPSTSYADAVARLAASSAAEAGRAFEALVGSTLEAASPSVRTLIAGVLVVRLLRATRSVRLLAGQAVRTDVIVHTRRSAPVLVAGPPPEAEGARLRAAVETVLERAAEAGPPSPRPAPDRASAADTGRDAREAELRRSRDADLAEARRRDREADLAADAEERQAELAVRALERRAELVARAVEHREAERARRRAISADRAAAAREAAEEEAAWREFLADRDAEARADAAVLRRLAQREAAEDRDADRRAADAEARAARRAADAERRDQQRARVERLVAAEVQHAAQDGQLESAELQNAAIEDAPADYEYNVIEGWVRQLNGENCPRCEAWADGKVRPLGTRMKWHVSCNCSARLVWTTEFNRDGYDITELDEPIARRDSFLSQPRRYR